MLSLLGLIVVLNTHDTRPAQIVTLTKIVTFYKHIKRIKTGNPDKQVLCHLPAMSSPMIPRIFHDYHKLSTSPPQKGPKSTLTY